MKRILEPEVMNSECEASSYASAAAHAYLSRIDESFVEHFARLGVRTGTVLDIGCGPGEIVLKLAARLPHVTFIGADLSDAMLELARQRAATAACANVRFECADAKAIPYPTGQFDAVISNSLLHHLEDPLPFLNEAARVVKPGGAVLLRDIRRPPGPLYPLWWRWFGRHYGGQMLRSYQDSLRAAFTPHELAALLRASALHECHIFRHALTHIGIERPAHLTCAAR